MPLHPEDPMALLKTGPIGSLYKQLRDRREEFVNRAEDCSRLTIPSILPDEGHTRGDRFPTPYQSAGAEGVSNLSEKLMLALFPASSSFFRLRPDYDSATFEGAAELLDEDSDLRRETDADLARIETKVMEVFEGLGWRPVIASALKSLIVTGNSLLYEQDETLKQFHLNQYVVERDGMGEVVLICTHEKVGLSTLSTELQQQIQLQNPGKKLEGHQDICSYTCISRVSESKWEWRQEIGGVETFSKSLKASDNPYIVLTWNLVSGEDYGRGRVEEMLGAIKSLESLSESALRAAAIASKHLLLNGARSGVSGRVLQQAKDGEVISGVTDPEQIMFLKVDKSADLQLILNRIDSLENQVQRAFLDFEAVRRNAERVTAEEIRVVALELDRSLGGVYSVLSQKLQLPLVRMLLPRVRLGDESVTDKVKPVIIAGLDALGRGHDFQRITSFVQAAVSTLGPDVVGYLNVPGLLKKAATSIGLDPEETIKSEEQVAQEQQAAQQQALIESSAGAQVAGRVADAALQTGEAA